MNCVVPVLSCRLEFPVCLSCGSDRAVALVDLPYVFKLLAAQLATANIKVQLQAGDGAAAAR